MSRKKQSTLENLIDLSSLLPWWGGLLLALISFVFLNHFANLETQQAKDISQLGNIVTKQIFITFAIFGQIIIPFAFVIGAIISAIKQNKRKRLYASAEKYKFHKTSPHPQQIPDPIKNMSWQEFEMLISEFFRKQHYLVFENLSGGPDGGIDLRIKKDGKTFFVQCKHWKKYNVGVSIVREQLGIMAAEGADGSIIVTSGLFTNAAIQFARQHGITLINGNELKEIITQTKRSIPKNVTQPPAPLCPLCSSTMIERTAKKGIYAGSKFWGCKNFPHCRGIMPK